MADDRDKVAFELVVPERLLLSAPVDMVVVPGREGDFGVLPGHALFISQIRPGVLEVHDQGRVSERIFLAGGFAEATPERCTVLADDAMPVDDLDRAEIEQRVKNLREDVEDAKTDIERAEAERKLAVAEAMREAAGAGSYSA